MKLFLLGLALACVGSAQFGGNARSIQSQHVKSPLNCSDTFVLTWVAANNQFECLAGGGGGGGAPTDATYITQTPNSSLSAEQALSTLATGVLKSTTGTGVLSIAGVSDILGPWTGTKNSTTVPAGDGTMVTISSVYTGITGVPANSLLGNNTGSPANAVAMTAVELHGNIGTNQSGGTLLTQPANSLLYTFGANSRVTSGSIGNPAFFTAARWDGTVGSPTAVQSGEQIGGYNSYAYDGATLIGPLGSFRCFANQTQSVGSGGTYCEVAATPNGSVTLTAGMRWQATGGVTLPSTVTGGDKGTGTFNATGLYQANVQVATLSGSEALTNKTYNGNTWTAGTGTFAVGAGKTFTVNNTLTFTGTDSSSVAFGAGGTVLYNGGALGTPSSGTLTNATGLPAAGVVGTAAILGANTFTALQTHTIGSVNTGVIASTGYSLTGSNATNMVDLAGTWNTTGTSVTGFKLAITNTAVGASSLLMNLLAGASGTTSEFSVDPLGNVTAAANVQGSTVIGTVNVKSNTLTANAVSTTMTIQDRSFSASGSKGVNMMTGTVTNSSGLFSAVLVVPTYNQTSTAAATDFTINRTETGVGSGAQLFFDMQVAGTSKASIDHLGNIITTPIKSTTGQRYVCVDTTGQLVSSAAACVGT